MIDIRNPRAYIENFLMIRTKEGKVEPFTLNPAQIKLDDALDAQNKAGKPMGYCRLGDSLGIVKADNGKDSTVFVRSATTDDDGQAVFPLKQAIAGVGAIARQSFGQLLDEPLFLSDTGIFAVTTNVVTSEKICQNRSFYIDGALNNESGLENACGVACYF